MGFIVGLRAGARYQTRAEFFARSPSFHVIPYREHAEALRLACEPGGVAVLKRAGGEVIYLRYENDVRDSTPPALLLTR